jgi:hypothetical protein
MVNEKVTNGWTAGAARTESVGRIGPGEIRHRRSTSQAAPGPYFVQSQLPCCTIDWLNFLSRVQETTNVAREASFFEAKAQH